VVRYRDGRPPREPPGSALLLCLSQECTVGDFRGLSRSVESDLLSVLLIYPKIFLNVFIICHLLLGFLSVLLYSTVCVLIVLVWLSVLAN